jgi:hypothetical protein
VESLGKIEHSYVERYEDNGDYILFKMGSRIRTDEIVRIKFVYILLSSKFIKDKNDIIFTPNGYGVLKKTGSNPNLSDSFFQK